MSPPWIGRQSDRDLEFVAAQLDLALDSLANLERIITSTGGHMEHDDQARLFEARAMLEMHWRRGGR